MRKKYLKGIVAGMMVGAVVLTDYSFADAKDKVNIYHDKYFVYDAVEYALQYAGEEKPGSTKGYNSEYYNWVGRGGDCTNFVSQCVYAGGFHMKADDEEYGNKVYKSTKECWYYKEDSRGNWKASKSWVDADKFGKYMNNIRDVTVYEDLSLSEVKKKSRLGDVIQIVEDGDDAIHSVIVTKKDAFGNTYVAAHSNNRHYSDIEEQYKGFKNKKNEITFKVIRVTEYK